MDSATEQLLARMIMARASLLDERSATDGVLSFLRRPPPQRGRPNERFLQVKYVQRGKLGSSSVFDARANPTAPFSHIFFNIFTLPCVNSSTLPEHAAWGLPLQPARAGRADVGAAGHTAAA